MLTGRHVNTVRKFLQSSKLIKHERKYNLNQKLTERDVQYQRQVARKTRKRH